MRDNDSRHQPHLLARVDGEILAERNMFRLDDLGALPTGDPDDEPPVPTDELVTSAIGAAVFASALSHHRPHVTVEHWSARPPAPPTPSGPPGPPGPSGPWERSAEIRLEREGDQVGLSSGVSRLPGPHRLRVPPGSYVLDVRCTGRAEVRARAAAGQSSPHGTEMWLLRLWPAVEGHQAIGEAGPGA